MFTFSEKTIYLLKKKDHSAFESMYNDTIDAFFRYAHSRYRMNTADIEDVIARTYCKIRDALDTYNDDYPFGAYIWTIFKNTLKDFFKKQHSIDFSTIESGVDVSAGELLADNDDVLDTVHNAIVREDVRSIMKHLDEKSYDVLYYKYIENVSYGEMEELFGVSQSVLRKRVSRALQRLQGLLSHYTNS